MCRRKWRVTSLWRGQLYDNGALLPDVISAARQLLLRSLVAKTKPNNPQALGFWRRVLQVHLCIVYFIGGVAKFLANGWWDGSNLWRSLVRPPFNRVSSDLLVQFKYALPLLGISICLLEISYPLFIWLKRTCRIWLCCILAMHAAIGLMMGLYLFSLVMIVMNLAAFGVAGTISREHATSGRTEP